MAPSRSALAGCSTAVPIGGDLELFDRGTPEITRRDAGLELTGGLEEELLVGGESRRVHEKQPNPVAYSCQHLSDVLPSMSRNDDGSTQIIFAPQPPPARSTSPARPGSS